MNEGIIKTLKEIIINRQYEQIRNKFSLDERILVLNNLDDIMSFLENELEDDGVLDVVESTFDDDLFYSSLFSDEEAKEIFERTTSNELLRNLLPAIKDDDYKLNIINEEKLKDIRLSILGNIKISNKLFDALDKIKASDEEFILMYTQVILTYIKTDDLKIKFVNRYDCLKQNSNMQFLINSLEDIDLKYYYLSRYIGDNKLKYKKYYEYKLIKNIKDDDIREIKLRAYVNEFIKNPFNIYIDPNDSLRDNIYPMEKKSITEVIFDIIISFKSDKKRLELLSMYRNLNESYKDINDEMAFIKAIIDHVEHFSNEESLRPAYNYILSKYKDYYKDKLNNRHLEMFVEKFGLETLRFLENKNIQDIITLNEENFTKFLNIFQEKHKKLNSDIINTVCNAIIQREFRIKQPGIYSTFSDIEMAIENKDKSMVIKLLGQLNEGKNRLCAIFKMEIDRLAEKLLSGDRETLSLLHNVTDDYISEKRVEYLKKRLKNIDQELNLNKKYSRNEAIKYYLSNISKEEIDQVMNLLENIDKSLLNKDQIKLIENESELLKVIEYKKSPKTIQYEGEKINLKVFSSLINYLYDNNLIKLPDNLNLPTSFVPKEILNESFLPILNDIEINKIKDILFDSKNYENLLRILDKYRLLGYGNTFNNLFKEADIEFNNDTLLGLITSFSAVNSKIEEHNEISKEIKDRLILLIDLCNCYSSFSSVYGMLFGQEDFHLLKTNPGPNASVMTKTERLDEALSCVIKMYNRSYITVPPLNEVINLKLDKKLKVDLGFVTSMENLTLGERTGACMRIGGAGNTLFDFCLENNNGFHIIFKNEENNRFVSRVSGFRNGNTVFLNQLRQSEDKTYTNKDIVSACKKVANLLIEKTKNSKYPINNVVISGGFAMIGLDDENLGVSNIKEGYNHFYSDVNNSAIVLATSNSDNSLVPIKLGPKASVLYKPLRASINKYTYSKEIIANINKIKIIDGLLKGLDIDEIDLTKDVDNIMECYVGEDWYITVDDLNMIEEFIVEARKDREELTNEMKQVKDTLFANLQYSISNERKVI